MSSTPHKPEARAPISASPTTRTPGNVILLDHLNFNHGRAGGHRMVSAFYNEILGLEYDPRKADNIEKGKNTIWMNAGITQFHLPEADKAQVFNGIIELSYPDMTNLQEIASKFDANLEALNGSKCSYKWIDSSDVSSTIVCTDPWGSIFTLKVDSGARDLRGNQPTINDKVSTASAITDITVFVDDHVDLDGIGRFYSEIMGCPVVMEQQVNPLSILAAETNANTNKKEDVLRVIMSPKQTLSFRTGCVVEGSDAHHSCEEMEEGPANYGVHLSMYVQDFDSAYKRADDIGALYVNHRFGRRAYDLENAKKQCMFRLLDLVDPKTNQPLLKLEHEIRAILNPDGSKYKSCPLDDVSMY